MQIESIENGNLRVWLTEEETEAWGVADGCRHGVRRVVRRVMTTAGLRSGDRVVAEMIPVEGGCVVLISPAVHKRRQPTVYRVSAELLPEVAARWHPLWTEVAQVYAIEGHCHVVVYGEQAEPLLREYGDIVGRGEAVAAHTAEYGQWQLTVPAPVPQEHEDRDR